MSAVFNITTVPSSVLKKKHLGIGYHQVWEAVAAGIIRFCHINSTENLADVMTKSLNNAAFHYLIKPYLFRVPVHVKG